MTAPTCPDPQALLDYAAGRLPPEARDALAAHVGGCADCLALAGAALAEGRDARTRGASPRSTARKAELARRDVPPQRLGRYVVLELLGAGGMGEVLLAYDPALDRRVAIKVALRKPGDDTQGLEARLQREAQSLARVVDPNVVAVHDVGNLDGRPFVAMEYVPGTTLKQRLKQKPPRREVLRLFLQAARGLAAAHRVGVVHRDFKPDNVLVDGKGNARVTDFGLAIMLEAPVESRPPTALPVDASDEDTQQVLTTKDNVVLGTPGYMPPEQWEGRTTDARSDQFSFCVSLHEGLLGERPFARSTARFAPPDFKPPPELLRRRRELPARLRRVLARGLALEPADRYASMDAIIAELERALRPSPAPWVAVAALAVAGVAGGAVMTSRSPCHGALERVQALRQQVPLALPEGLAARVEAAAARFEAAWAAAWQDACVETHERKEQPGEVLALRNECLARQARRYELVLKQLAVPRADVRATALEALETGQRPDACLGVDALLAVDQPGPAQRDAVRALSDQLLEARVLVEVGRYDDAREALAALAAPVAAAAFRPTTALHTYLQGYLALREQRWRDARPLLRDGFTQAVAARDQDLAARAGAEAVFVSGYALGFLDEARLEADLTRGLVQRLDSRDLEGKLENSVGLVAMAQGQLEEARVHLDRAHALRLRVFGADHLDTAKVSGNLGLLAQRQGRLDDAEALLREDLRVRELRLGPEHPQVAVTLVNLATLAGDRGRLDDAVALLRRALELRVAVFGPTHPLVLATRMDLGQQLARAKRFDEARALQREVLAQARDAHGDDSVEVADALDALAVTEADAKQWPAALEAAQGALARYQAHLEPRDDAVMNAREREADLLLELGRTDEARARLEALVTAWRAEPDAGGPLAAVLTSVGRLELVQRRGPRAVAALAEARRLVEPLEWHPARLGEIEFLLAKACALAGQGADARAHGRAARDWYEKAKAEDELKSVEVWLAAQK